ncbi:complex I intermediate-associated protein 30, mitochondrial [Myxocyprinus asiaticus]|uniref:complex I intermediate-associated protein 30, mitochondrial n=1 Tax=Myxocyprinus asiaticus TaxID=70543 RepID=UPI0022234585|nr:complex I intermediate-associated protein 30, mitochondrial [Myxocyprinus asiaticus]
MSDLITRGTWIKWLYQGQHSKLCLEFIVSFTDSHFYPSSPALYCTPGASMSEITADKDKPPDTHWPWQKIRLDFSKGVDGIKKQFGLLKDEFVQCWTGPEGKPLIEHILEQTRVQWEFRGPESLNQWIVPSARPIYRSADISLSPIYRYRRICLLICAYMKTFRGNNMRIRGDGRPWMVNISAETSFSHQSDDIYSYFLYTRGGPYWQDVKIPFTKFFLSSQGRIQDDQHVLWLEKVNSIGFTFGDKADGPFQLEIDITALCNDHTHTGEFAYELYKRNRGLTGLNWTQEMDDSIYGFILIYCFILYKQ